ncbi:MAG: ABC transporter transmembrane domain-containing protein [Bacteroidota bacterium]
MIKNLFYVFKWDRKGIQRALFWEWLHGVFIAAPSGMLLLILWEFFADLPDVSKIWTYIGIMCFLFLGQLFVANKAMLSSNLATYEISRKLRLGLGNKLQKLSLGYYKKRDPGDLAAVVLQDVANFESIFGHSVTNIANALFGTTVLSVFLLLLDWRLALTLMAALIIVFPIDPVWPKFD